MVATKRRKVTYGNLATNKQGLTYYSESVGYETVEEHPYCVEHYRSAPTSIVAEVRRRYSYLSVDPQKFKQD